MGLGSWIIVGLVAGVLAKLVMPGRDPGGCIITTVIGIVGALLGGFIMSRLGYGGVNGINFWSILVATLGAIVFLAVYRMVVRPE